jgi:type II secretory pathway component PulJ
MTTPAPRPRPRRGAGLAEIMVAMIIFAAVATSYAAVTLRYATRMKTISAGAARSARLPSTSTASWRCFRPGGHVHESTGLPQHPSSRDGHQPPVR